MNGIKGLKKCMIRNISWSIFVVVENAVIKNI